MNHATPIAAVLLSVLVVGAVDAAVDLPRDIVRLQGLDKVTARVSTFDVTVGEAAPFGTLEIIAEACFEAPPTEPPESAAFLRINDEPPNQPMETVFAGWMFASSPALSALEHAVFDIWVIDCLEHAELVPETPVEPEDEEGPLPRRRP